MTATRSSTSTPSAQQSGKLSWRGDHGFLPVKTYDQSYFDKYVAYSKTDLGRKLNDFRMQTVLRTTQGGVLDIGIGCGHFVEEMNKRRPCKGFDVNPAGIAWLHKNGLWSELKRAAVWTFWDSFEHIDDPFENLDLVEEAVIMSIPIFRDEDHVRGSKHFRPDEHYWYFTEEGLERLMAERGLFVTDRKDTETRLGREDILTFVFGRA